MKDLQQFGVKLVRKGAREDTSLESSEGGVFSNQHQTGGQGLG